MTLLLNTIRSSRGQALIELGLVLALVAGLMIGSFTALQVGIAGTFTSAAIIL